MADEKPTPPNYKPGDLCHLELPVNDVARAKAFYGEVFGWTFQDVPGMDYTLFATPGNVVNGGFFSPSDKMPAKVINYMLVDSLDTATKRVEQFGGKVLSPKIDVPGHGSFVHVLDSEGNLIALWQGN